MAAGPVAYYLTVGLVVTAGITACFGSPSPRSWYLAWLFAWPVILVAVAIIALNVCLDGREMGAK